MTTPKRSRPHMPGYLRPGAGGTLDWSWAEQRLLESKYYWVGTTWPDGRPHLSPVWGAWFDDCLWFSCDPSSRKARNLALNPHCTVASHDPIEPVVVEGSAVRVVERDDVVRFVDVEKAKYETEWQPAFVVDFFAPGTYRVIPRAVVALDERTFDTSPTRWTFDN